MSDDGARIFSFSELKTATNDFSDQLGGGGFGLVYRGTIDGKQVAVKKMKKEALKKGIPSFEKEIDLLSACDHENIISLVGYCDEGDDKLLVYEFMSNGSLFNYLYKREGTRFLRPRLSTVERLVILIGVAKGIEYLHSGPVYDVIDGVAQNIIHGDLKTDNVLLDDELVPKIADFGLSRTRPVGPSSSNIVTKNTQGTEGYLAPECYQRNYKPSRKADVYAFGVVFLEMLCERPGWSQLVQLGRDHAMRGDLETFAPEHVGEDIYPECLRACENLIRDCLENDPDKRPTMSQVLLELESALSLQKQKPSQTPSQQVVGSQITVTIPKALSSGFSDCVVLFHTSNGIVTKTQELCQEVRQILDLSGKRVDERDVYLNPSYMKELRQMFGSGRLSLPQVFIGGKYIGGADEIKRLNARGELKKKLERIPKRDYPLSCDACQNTRFVSLSLCPYCCFWKTDQNMLQL